MSFGEYTIKYNSVSVPSIRGENDVELLLMFWEDKWTITRNLGTIYSQVSTVIELGAMDVETMLKSLSDIQIPLLPNGEIGLDGTTYALEISHGRNSATYEWWEDIPEGFDSLKMIIDKLFQWSGIME
jgi:hypothetical protein